MNFKRINREDCKKLLLAGEATVLDIRDPHSYESGHIDNAVHIEHINIERFVDEQPKDKPLVICCYHGISSQSAAAYFAEKGFTEVFSLDGGYEGWRS